MAHGEVLSTGSIDGYQALGAFGQPVHKSYVQLRATIEARLGPRHANFFARPQIDERTRAIRWVSPVAGPARRWADLDPDEQAGVALDLALLRHGFQRCLDDLGGGPGGGAAFAAVLAQALQTPNDGHLHLVGNQPVASFWGFSEYQRAGFDVLGLAPAPVAVAAPVAPAAGLPWWGWLAAALGLLALLALLWWLWPQPEPTQPLAPIAPAPTAPSAPDPVAPMAPDLVPPVLRDPDGAVIDRDRVVIDRDGVVRDRQGMVLGRLTPDGTVVPDGVVVPDGAVVPDGTDGAVVPDGTDGTVVPDGTAPVSPEDALTPDAPGADAQSDPDDTPPPEDVVPTDPAPTDPAPAEPTPVDPAAEPGATDLPLPGPVTPDPAATDPTTPDPTTPDPATPPPPLPDPAAGGQGAADPLAIPDAAPGGAPGGPGLGFVRGRWRSQGGLVDQSTGRQLDQTYEFDDQGRGTAVVRRADGVECRAPAQAAMRDGKLTVEELENLRCADGAAYEKSTTVCERDAAGRTRCRGANAGGTGFDVRIDRAQP